MDPEMHKGRGLLSAAAGAAMAASIVFGPVAPVEQTVAFSDVPVAPAVLGEEGAIHLARRSWLEENEELKQGGLSGKDEEEGPIAERKVLSSFLSKEKKETREKITTYSVVSNQPPSLHPPRDNPTRRPSSRCKRSIILPLNPCNASPLPCMSLSHTKCF